MENPLSKMVRSLTAELPYYSTLDEYLDFILPAIKPWSEDLHEERFYIGKAWSEIRDEDSFYESILNFFNEEGEYLQSIDGNVHQGNWRIMPGNKLLVELKNEKITTKSELFDLVYLDDSFFILRKHGDQMRKGRSKYFMMGMESVVAGLEWREVVELLFNKYRSNNQYYKTFFFLILAIIVLVLLFSAF